jgi:hypothetical protein
VRAWLWLLIAEAAIYFGFYNREIVWNLSDQFDQAAYLSVTYGLVERIGMRGWPALVETLTRPIYPTGVLLPVVGAVAVGLTGAGRLAALSLNFLAFAGLQALMFHTVRVKTENVALACASVALLLCQGVMWFWAGGLFDFRIDFIAYCLFGMWVCAVLLSGPFLHWRWTVIASAIAAILVLFRFFTIIYVLGIMGGFAVIAAYAAPKRIGKIAASAAAIVTLVARPLYIHRHALYEYYGVGHFVGPEKELRAAEAGVHGLADHLLYYPASLAIEHLGWTFWLGAAILAVAAIGSLRAAKPQWTPFRFDLLFLLGAIAGPLLVLTLDQAKSPVVAGIAAGPVVLALVIVAAPALSQRASYVAAAVIACLAVIFQTGHVLRYTPRVAGERADLRAMANLATWINDYALEHKWTNPSIAINMISSKINASALDVWSFETTRTLVGWRPVLGATIFAASREEVLAQAAQSDVLILSSQPQFLAYPFHVSMEELTPALFEYAQSHMKLVRQVTMQRGTISVFARAGQSLGIGSGLEFILGRGWSQPEPWGVWSDGVRAQLLLQIKPEDFPTGVRIQFSFTSYVSKARDQRLEISLAGRKLASRTFNESQPQQLVEIDLDSSSINPSATTRLDLSIPDAIAPAESGGADKRQLGVGLTNVRVVKQ